MANTIYDYFNSNTTVNQENLENQFNQPMPLIGFYITIASFICTILITVDILLNFARGRLWFPCKLFAINATSLTVIAVSMKLPLDLNNPMYGRFDQLAKFSSTVFLCTMLASFMPSLAAMDDMELVMHMVALAIMVITICVNLFIQIATEMIIPAFKQLYLLTICSLILMLLIMICSALTISVSKKVLNSKYKKMHTEIVDFVNTSSSGFTRKEKIEKLKDDVTKYWIMAITCSPQFVMASSEACCACGALCVAVDVFLILAVKTIFTYDNVRNCDSVYMGLIIKILIVQCIGVVLGSIAPVFRLLAAFNFRLSTNWSRNYLQVYRIDSSWTQRLVQWKDISPLDDLLVGGRVFRKSIHNVKNFILDFSILFVTTVAILSKTIRLVANFLLILFVYCYFGFVAVKRKCMNEPGATAIHNGDGLSTDSESVRRFALQFHDGVELSDRTLNNITNGIKIFVESARKRNPKNLMDFLEKSRNFNGVLSFDNDQIPHLNSQEPPNGWSLPVVTLTAIALALPNIEKGTADKLLYVVKKGLSYVKHVEKTLDCKGDLVVIRKASDFVWRGVELHDIWLKNNLKSQETTLQWLCEKAKAIVMEERTTNGDHESPKNWSINTIAANSMYRICQTIMLDYQENDRMTDKEVFEKISVMIADILCACFVNLPRVISMKCYSRASGKREESVRTAACLLGETEEILKILSERDLPSLDLHQMAYMDEWRRAMKL